MQFLCLTQGIPLRSFESQPLRVYKKAKRFYNAYNQKDFEIFAQPKRLKYVVLQYFCSELIFFNQSLEFSAMESEMCFDKLLFTRK